MKIKMKHVISIRCPFKFTPKVGVEESIVNAPRITDLRSRITCLNLTSLFALFVFLLVHVTLLILAQLTTTLNTYLFYFLMFDAIYC
jgi:hypothetical protein